MLLSYTNYCTVIFYTVVDKFCTSDEHVAVVSINYHSNVFNKFAVIVLQWLFVCTRLLTKL